MKHYEFSITLSGDGETPEEAWEDAVTGFSLEPGAPDYDRMTEEEIEE
jgi:hypothetical protein